MGLFAAPALAQTEWVATTYDQPWQQQEIPAKAKKAKAVVKIDTNNTAQEINGFGTCFSEQTWKSLSLLTDQERRNIMNELFLPGKGLSLTLARTPIGASDFALSYYSYDDIDQDFGLQNFSVARDEAMLIPLIQSALKVNPALKIWASPWCPPAWMKKNKHYACMSSEKLRQRIQKMMESLPDSVKHRMGGDSGISGWLSVDNGLPASRHIDEGEDAFIVEPQYLDAYARYFGKYVDAYKANGINISMVAPQNEFNSNQPYPACVWKPASLATFIGKYLGPEMDKRGVDVYYGTIERARLSLSDSILSDPDARKYIKGMTFQWAGKDALPGLHQKYPDLPCIMSEQECGDGKNDWKNVEHIWDTMVHYFKYGVRSWFYWNTALREGVPSAWGWKQNSLVTVNPQTKTYRYTPEFYLLKHASHYVQHGAKYVNLAGTYANAMAFVNPDGSVIVLLANQKDQPQAVTLLLGKKPTTVTLQPHSVNTLKF